MYKRQDHTEAGVEEPQTTGNATDVVNQDTSERTAPLHNNNPIEAAATDGGAEAGAEDAHTRHAADGMLRTSEHPAENPSFPLVTSQVSGTRDTMTKNGDTKTTTKTTTMDMTTKITRGRETIPGEGIEEEPSPVHANLLQSPHFDAVLRR